MATILRLFKLLIILCFLFNSFANCEYSLKTLFLVHRHGNRAPSKTFPNDRYRDDSNFPDGFGQLTKEGKQRMYNVGLFLRDRYNEFFGESIREVYVRSSGKERCIESTQLLVNGAYPPMGRWIWNETIKFQPVPVQSPRFDNDSMLNMFSYCLAANQEFDRIFKSDYGSTINKANKKLFKNLTRYTGAKIKDFFDADYVYDTLQEERLVIENYTDPDWVSPKMLESLKNIHVAKFKFFSQSKQMQRLRFGVFLNELTTKLQDALKTNDKKTPHYTDADDDSVRKVNIYSTHDIFLYNLLDALNVPTTKLPDFGATIIFELHQNVESIDAKESAFVRMFYLNDTKSNSYNEYKIVTLQKNDCDIDCNIKDFLKSFSNLLLTEKQWKSECKLKVHPTEADCSLGYYIVDWIIKIACVGLVIGFIGIVIYKLRKNC